MSLSRSVVKRGLRSADTVTYNGQPVTGFTRDELLATIGLISERNLQLERWFAAIAAAMKSINQEST
jgi:hypothetical protein